MTSLGGNLVYNLQAGFVKQVVNTSNYWAYPYNRFLVNNGDGQSIGVKQGVGTLHAKIEAFATIASSIAREVYLGIAIDASNENISAEAYITTTYDVPISNIYMFVIHLLNYMEEKKSDYLCILITLVMYL